MSINPLELPEEVLKARHHIAPAVGYYWDELDWYEATTHRPGCPEDMGGFPDADSVGYLAHVPEGMPIV